MRPAPASPSSADLFLYLGYNPAGQIASRTQTNDAYAWTGAYTVNRAYTTNGLNQYMAAGTASFTYDANGNLTSDGSTAFTYDVENRLVAASGARTAALRRPDGAALRSDRHRRQDPAPLRRRRAGRRI